MAGFGFDAGHLRAKGKGGEKYVVLQVVLTEKFIGTGSGVSSLTNLQNVINEQAAKGYRLHTISTAASGSKGFMGGDKIQATMIFERLDYMPETSDLTGRKVSSTEPIVEEPAAEDTANYEEDESKKWVCPKCGTKNGERWIYCSLCGKQRKMDS